MNNKKDIFLRILAWIPAAAIMILIFCFSSQHSDESAQVSQGFLLWLENVFSLVIDHGVLRKIAHGLEFFVLGITASLGFFVTLKRTAPVATLVLCFVYSVTDEIHQIFVPGRACRAKDIFIDSCGAAAGIILFMIFVAAVGLIAKAVKNKKQNG